MGLVPQPHGRGRRSVSDLPVLRFLFPPRRTFDIRSPLDPATAAARLDARLASRRFLTAPEPGSVVGSAAPDRFSLRVFSGQNSWQPVMRGRIVSDPHGGSTIHGTVGQERWVGLFMAFWLFFATSIWGGFALDALAGGLSGHPLIVTDSSGSHPLDGLIGALVGAGGLLLFDGFAVGLTMVGRRWSKSHPDRLVTFLCDAVEGRPTTADSPPST
jgi:hypothetical protein